MDTQVTTDKTDEYDFLRLRAAQLWDEGMVDEARAMLAVIDEDQIRLLKPLLQETFRAVP
ncbi:MAG: hypothetical protein VB099_00155 [Candidatus Limiplasma sp.]|nr:hypothetical protein [Candidatus Limiplasma sp.]